MPHWGNAEVFEGRTLRIGYINDTTRSLSNEAIDITILGGENAGWHDSLDARPLGVWLAIPVGAAIAGFGYMGIRYRKNDLKTTAGQPRETTSITDSFRPTALSFELLEISPVKRASRY